MQLRFTRWRTLPALQVPSEPDCDTRAAEHQTIVGIGGLSALDRSQLVACAGRGSDLQFTVEELFTLDFGRRGGDRSWIAEATEVPFEWWDVVDAHDVARFQAWFYHADCALFFAAGGTTVVAQGIQFGSAWEIHGGLSPDAERALTAACRVAIAAHPTSDLARHFAFER